MPENQNINLDTSFNLSIPKLNPDDQINNVSTQDNNISSSATGSNENKSFERALLTFNENYDFNINKIITEVGEINSVYFETDFPCTLESNSLSPNMSSDELTCKICTKFKFDQNNVGKLKISLGDQELKEFDFSNYQKNQNNSCLCNFSNFPKKNLLEDVFNLNFSTTTNEHPICRNVHIEVSIEIENKDFKASSNSITLNFIQEQMLTYQVIVQYNYYKNISNEDIFANLKCVKESLIQSGSIKENSANVYSNDSPSTLNLENIVNSSSGYNNYTYNYAVKKLFNGTTYIKDIDSFGATTEPDPILYIWYINIGATYVTGHINYAGYATKISETQIQLHNAPSSIQMPSTYASQLYLESYFNTDNYDSELLSSWPQYTPGVWIINSIYETNL